MEPDTDDYSTIPQFGSVGSAGKPYVRPAPQVLYSDEDSDDCQILDPLDPAPITIDYPLPSYSANPDASEEEEAEEEEDDFDDSDDDEPPAKKRRM